MVLKLSLPLKESSERRAMISMLGAMAFYSVQDALCRLASLEVPTSQILFVRGLFGIAFLAVLLVYLRIPVLHRSLLDIRVWMRAAIDVLASATYIYALRYMELANATAIAMSAPFMLTILAVIFLKEHVGIFRWLTVVTGFLGVMLVVQPASGSFNAWSLLVLLSAAFIATRDMLTRVIGSNIPTLLLSLTNVVATTAVGGLWGMVDKWPALHMSHFSVLVLAGVAMCIANLLLIVAMRTGTIGSVAQIRYVALLFAAIIGYLVWGYIPNELAFWGFALIVGSGILAQRIGHKTV